MTYHFEPPEELTLAQLTVVVKMLLAGDIPQSVRDTMVLYYPWIEEMLIEDEV